MPFLIILNYNLITATTIGVIIGVAQGGAWALGVVSNRKQMNASYEPMMILTAQWRWRYMDGLVLLFTAGALAASLLSLR